MPLSAGPCSWNNPLRANDDCSNVTHGQQCTASCSSGVPVYSTVVTCNNGLFEPAVTCLGTCCVLFVCDVMDTVGAGYSEEMVINGGAEQGATLGWSTVPGYPGFGLRSCGSSREPCLPGSTQHFFAGVVQTARYTQVSRDSARQCLCMCASVWCCMCGACMCMWVLRRRSNRHPHPGRQSISRRGNAGSRRATLT